jgi:hypothetical protein
MYYTTPWAALYFVSLNIIGAYIIMNLFLAILLSNFERFEVDESTPRRLSFVHKVGRVSMHAAVVRFCVCDRPSLANSHVCSRRRAVSHSRTLTHAHAHLHSIHIYVYVLPHCTFSRRASLLVAFCR